MYVQEKIGSPLFNVKYGITEYKCVEEGEPLPQLRFSQFAAARSMAKDLQKGLGTTRFDAKTFPQVLITIKYESANTLVERSVAASANLVIKGKKTLPQLKRNYLRNYILAWKNT